jgi:hypothetical protein
LSVKTSLGGGGGGKGGMMRRRDDIHFFGEVVDGGLASGE